MGLHEKDAGMALAGHPRAVLYACAVDLRRRTLTARVLHARAERLAKRHRRVFWHPICRFAGVARADAGRSWWMMWGVFSGDLPDIDFARIRPYGQPASRAGAFEELASILVEQGAVEWPDGVRFERFGDPDGGREGRGVLPSGDVWAWQVKYIFEFDTSAVGQVTSSVHRVLGTEPKLKRYFVVIPFDLPVGTPTRGHRVAGSSYRRTLAGRTASRSGRKLPAKKTWMSSSSWSARTRYSLR